MKNTQEFLQEKLDDVVLQTALSAGRRLFEAGHFAFAALSAARALPLDEAKTIVTVSEARALLPARLLQEAEIFQALRTLVEQEGRLWADAEAFLTFLATTELNHVDALPLPTARLAAETLGYLMMATRRVPTFDSLATAWSDRLHRALTNPHATPFDFAGFLSAPEEQDLREAVFILACRAEILDRALRRFGRVRLVGAPSPSTVAAGVGAAHAKKREAVLAYVAGGEAPEMAACQGLLVENRVVDACTALEAALLKTHAFERALRDEHGGAKDLGRGSGRRDLALENRAYVDALGRQLRLLGVDDADVRALDAAVLAYAERHASACAEILDDEMNRMAPRVPRDALTRARLHVRHDDRDYPLSVAARNAVLAASVRS